MDKTNNLDVFMTDLADSIREATGETGSINAQSFSTRITGLGTGKQDKLVSGENIKTINGESILGSGDIEISDSSSGMKNVLDNSNVLTLKPNERVIRYGTSINNLTISGFEVTPFSENPLDNGDSWVDEYSVVFKTDPLFTDFGSITVPDYVLWANGMFPEIEDDTVYELSITRYSLNPSDSYYKAVLTPFKSVE